MTIIPSPLSDQEKSDEPFLAASAGEVEFLEEQLLAEEFRVVVVRAVDLVLPLREGVTYAAIPARGIPFDALLNRQGHIADEMEDGSRIGVLNLRSKIQISTLWPNLEVDIVNGGLDTAMEILLRKCEIDGLVLPAATTEHLGIQGIVSEIFYPEMVLPSSGQGILALLCRSADKEVQDLLKDVHSEATFLEMEAEHAFIQHFAADQDLPISVLARVDHDAINITGAIGSVSGSRANKQSIDGKATEATTLGAELASKLMFNTETLIELLEADFPDGLPGDDLDDFEDSAVEDTDLTDLDLQIPDDGSAPE